MAKQDDFVRITLRIPSDLHKRLETAAGAGSMNAEIVSRLEGSFEEQGAVAELTRIRLEIAELSESVHKTYDDLKKKVDAHFEKYPDSERDRGDGN